MIKWKGGKPKRGKKKRPNNSDGDKDWKWRIETDGGKQQSVTNRKRLEEAKRRHNRRGLEGE